jgi:hypothetical protein
MVLEVVVAVVVMQSVGNEWWCTVIEMSGGAE